MSTPTLPVPVAPPDPAEEIRRLGELDLIAAFFAGRKSTTVRAYRHDLRDFARFIHAPSVESATSLLLMGGQASANRTVLAYRVHLQGKRLATATIARRLAAIRSVVKLARTLGYVAWGLDVEAPTVEPRRDTRGPDEGGWKKLWAAARDAGDGPRARRDHAALALLYSLALRRAEAVALDLADVDFDEGTVAIVGKGRTEPERLTLPAPTVWALREWVEARGSAPGPLFPRIDRHGHPRGRLTGDGLCQVIKTLSVKAGLRRPVRPHGLRHAAITRALDLGRDIREVRRFSRHRKLETVIRYDDARRDMAGEIARELAGEWD